jgi:pyruvate ferredoxin oxidoreductase delta subunit
MDPKKFRILTSDSYSGPGDAGRTGSWRVLRPVVDYEKCTPARKEKDACYLCWLYCPDGVISKTTRVSIDLEYCKGCGICSEECPTNAIEMVQESSFSDEESS